MANMIWNYPNRSSPTSTLTFNPTLVKLVQPQPQPIQMRRRSLSGKIYVFTLSTNIEESLPCEFEDLHESDIAGLSGFNSLDTFIRTTVAFSSNTFDLDDPDGDQYTVRYMGGLESFREAEGRSRVGTRWTGTILLEVEL